jgi:O-antigen/teichoic acid export membrane protein
LIAQLWYPEVARSFNFLPETYWLVFAHFISLALWTHVQLSLQGAKMPRVQGYLLLLERIAIIALLLFCWYINKLYISTAILCYIASSFGSTLIGLYVLRSYIWSRFTVDFDFYKKIVVFSLPLLPVTLFGYFSGQSIDALFISRFLSTSDLGVYSVAMQMNGILLQLPTLANSLLIPLFVTLEKEDQTHKTLWFFNDVLPSMSLVWCVLCSLVGFVGYYTIPLIFGPQFAGAAAPLWILVASAAIAFPVLAGYSALSHAISATYISMFGAIFAAVANIIFNFVLIPRYGMIGCAWATVIAYTVSVICFAFFLRRSGKIALSWIAYSILPALIGAVIFTVTETAYWALLGCLASAIVVTYLHKNSIRMGVKFMKNSMVK